jgi:hypothetical protein
MGVFLVAYTCFNLNLENFAETWSNRQQLCIPIHSPSLKLKHHYESEKNFLCSEVKIIFALKFVTAV